MPTTNPYEVARFIAHGKTHVVYMNSRGYISAVGFAEECVRAFDAHQSIKMGYAMKHTAFDAKRKQAVIERDGNRCFFCKKEMTWAESSLEHLVARARGGPNHLDNMALAHKECNARAANLTLMEKIRIRERS